MEEFLGEKSYFCRETISKFLSTLLEQTVASKLLFPLAFSNIFIKLIIIFVIKKNSFATFEGVL